MSKVLVIGSLLVTVGFGVYYSAWNTGYDVGYNTAMADTVLDPNRADNFFCPLPKRSK